MKYKQRLIMGLIVWMAFSATAGVISSLAQEEEFKPTVAPKEKSLTLLQLIKSGGITMIPLGLFSMAVVALVIRNFLALKEEKLLRPDLVPTLTSHLADRSVEEARQICRADPTLLTAVVGAGLDRVTGDTLEVDVIKEAIEEAGSEQMMTYMSPISYLSIIGAVSPMLGLLGTVSGMIKAFQNISVGGMGKAELLAANIGEALVTTATGLVIAIPAMLFYFYFKNKFMKIMATAGRISGSLLDALRTGQVAPALSAETPAES